MSANARISSLWLFIAQCFNALSFQFHCEGTSWRLRARRASNSLTLTVLLQPNQLFLCLGISFEKARVGLKSLYAKYHIFFLLEVNTIKLNLFSIWKQTFDGGTGRRDGSIIEWNKFAYFWQTLMFWNRERIFRISVPPHNSLSLERRNICWEWRREFFVSRGWRG